MAFVSLPTGGQQVRCIAQEDHKYRAVSRSGSENFLSLSFREDRDGHGEDKGKAKDSEDLLRSLGFHLRRICRLDVEKYEDWEQEQCRSNYSQNGSKQEVEAAW